MSVICESGQLQRAGKAMSGSSLDELQDCLLYPDRKLKIMKVIQAKLAHCFATDFGVIGIVS